jgi:hypothetical protein
MGRLRTCRISLLLVCIGAALSGCCGHQSGFVRIHGCGQVGCTGCGTDHSLGHAGDPDALGLHPGPHEVVVGPSGDQGEYFDAAIGPAAAPPPGISRFHPVPTRPVFAATRHPE